jgi:ABC-type multidrug transport system ATPase subunit
MSEIVMRAENLTKAYTLYPSSWDRMRDIPGLRGRPGVDFPQHMAIDDVMLTVRAGENVAFIGRNGAGTSTLLKLVTGLIEPTSGRGDACAVADWRRLRPGYAAEARISEELSVSWFARTCLCGGLLRWNV